MLLKQLLTETVLSNIYHATNAEPFKQFLDRPTWFSKDFAIAKGWEANLETGGIGVARIYTCKFSGKIASKATVKKAAKQVWPNDDFLYSMFDENVGEFERQDIKKFIKILEDAGYDAAYHDDYDPHDFGGSSESTSLVVFHPNKTVTISYSNKSDTVSVKSSITIPQKLDFTPFEELKVGDEIEYTNNSIQKAIGTIVALVKKGEKYRFDLVPKNHYHENDVERGTAGFNIIYVKPEKRYYQDTEYDTIVMYSYIKVKKL